MVHKILCGCCYFHWQHPLSFNRPYAGRWLVTSFQ